MTKWLKQSITLGAVWLAAPLAASFAQALERRDDLRLVGAAAAESVYAIRTRTGFKTLIEFDPGEGVQQVALGDETAFRHTPDPTGRAVIIAPMRAEAVTNLVVVTNRRVYAFTLETRPRTESTPLRIRITDALADTVDPVKIADLPPLAAPSASAATALPARTFKPHPIAREARLAVAAQPPAALAGARIVRVGTFLAAQEQLTAQAASSPSATTPRPPALQVWNATYSISGAPLARPRDVIDNGQETHFALRKEAPQPTIIAIEPNGAETPIPVVVRDGRWVAPRIAPRWRVETDKGAATVVNVRWGRDPLAIDPGRRPQG
jgi:type IV secretory pathway VirB9-like protein